MWRLSQTKPAQRGGRGDFLVSVRRPYVRALNGGRLRKKAASARAVERRADKTAAVKRKIRPLATRRDIDWNNMIYSRGRGGKVYPPIGTSNTAETTNRARTALRRFTRAISPLSRNPPSLAGPPLPAVATPSYTRPSPRLLPLLAVLSSCPLLLHHRRYFSSSTLCSLAGARLERGERERKARTFARATGERWSVRGGGTDPAGSGSVCADRGVILDPMDFSTRRHAFFFVSSRTIMILLR